MPSPAKPRSPASPGPGGEGTPPARSRRRPRLRILALGAGAALLVAFLVAGYVDYRNFDQTSGGYDPPYTDWTGTPIDWDAAEVTDGGFRRDGIVLDNMLDCTSGMISFRAAGLVSFNFRKVSPRAIAVHEPREACTRAGFEPEF
jgi:hypothetical protein